MSKTYEYVYASGKLMRQVLTVTIGNSTTTYAMDFFYDASGYPFAVKYNGDLCYYITNLQGDVMSIVDAQGEVVAEYEYDPYGNIVSQSGPLADVNPLRYRGYVYDTETQFYYLQTRYYDPELGRLLNHDVVFDYDVGMPGYNLFVYCGNNPVNRIDISGTDSTQLEDNQVDLDETAISGSTPAGNAATSIQTYYPPNNGFSGSPQKQVLSQGTTLQRTGSLNGSFVAPAGTPPEMLSLPYNQIGESTTYLIVQEPTTVLAGTAVSWFGQIGGGTQYFLLDGSVATLLEKNILIIGGK